jgi:precorrin-8X/cobalt-precorrin-8 methylmutase
LLFDRFVFVDWSASSKPKTGRDSVWSGDGNSVSVLTHNPPTRHQAFDLIRELLVSAVQASERVLIGFDFPYGYPAGLAKALDLPGRDPPWRRMWAELVRRIVDDERNHNNRFPVAEDLNERLGTEPGPYWGAPAARRHLARTKGLFPYRTRTGIALAEYRVTEQRGRRLRQLSSTWKLHFQPTVGSQALLGLPRLAGLRHDPVLAAVSRVWPFETGFSW